MTKAVQVSRQAFAGEARIIEPEAHIIVALVGALGPGDTDLGPAGTGAVAGLLSPERSVSRTVRTFVARIY